MALTGWSRMWEGTEQIVLAARPEAVWAVLTDVARHPELAGSGEIGALRLDGPVGPGSTWEADIRVPGIEAPFVSRSRVLVFEAPREFSWTSEPRPVIIGEPRSVPLVSWSFRLTREGEATVLEHTFRVVEPEVGAEELREFFEQTNRVASIRAGMRQTLENVNAMVEGSPGPSAGDGRLVRRRR